MKNVYVGNLPYDITSEQLGEIFAETGEVTSAQVIIDRATGQSRGFGFVEYSTEEEASNAVEHFNSAELDGRQLRVSIAQPKSDRGGGGGGGYRGGGGGGRGGGGGGRGGYDRGGRGGGGGGRW